MAWKCSYQKRRPNDLIYNAPTPRGWVSFIWEPTRCVRSSITTGQTPGKTRTTPALPASTLPPPTPQSTDLSAATPPGAKTNSPPRRGSRPRPFFSPSRSAPAATTRPTLRRFGRTPRHNSYILAIRNGKAYGLVFNSLYSLRKLAPRYSSRTNSLRSRCAGVGRRLAG